MHPSASAGGPPPAPPHDPEIDRRFMAAALVLARRNAGRAWPNPSVGAIVVRTDGGRAIVVGRGVTAPGGRPHAETIALAAAGEAARGATVYVTLEPCAHHGKTPPCSEALVRAGVARVVTAVEDPDPRVAGGGHAILRRNGIAVTTGVLGREAARVHAGHISRIRRQRPHLLLKLAMSSDGFIGRVGDGQVAISGPLSRAYSHGLRCEHDAIMVGIGTVLNDDPELTCRLPGLTERSPIRVVLDRAARIPLTAKLVRSAGDVATWIFVGPEAPAERVAALSAAGVLVRVAEQDGAGRLDLADALYQLGRAGITSVISEGGATVARALLEQDLVDEAHLVVAPLTIGEGGVPALGGLPLDHFDAGRFDVVTRRRLGEDRLTHYWRKERG